MDGGLLYLPLVNHSIPRAVVSWLCLPLCLSVCVPPLCTHIAYVISRAYEPHVHVHMLKFKAVELTKV